MERVKLLNGEANWEISISSVSLDTFFSRGDEPATSPPLLLVFVSTQRHDVTRRVMTSYSRRCVTLYRFLGGERLKAARTTIHLKHVISEVVMACRP